MSHPHDIDPAKRQELIADCDRCAGLCCVVPTFAESGDFAYDKEAGVPCRHLQGDFRCDIHSRLREEGFRGCVVFDCHGAGQKVVQHTFGGRDWQGEPNLAPQMFATFRAMRPLHELLMYLSEALKLEAAAELFPELRARFDEIDDITHLDDESLMDVDVPRLKEEVHELLLRVGELVRSTS